MRVRSSAFIIGIGFPLILALQLVGCEAEPVPPEASLGAQAPLPEALAPDVLASLQGTIAAREYQVSRSSHGLQAPNRAQNLRTYFEPDGIRVHDRTAPGSPTLLTMRLRALGRREAREKVEPGRVTHAGPRAEIRRPGLVEWYENTPRGLEQGFTLMDRPEGAGSLWLELALGGATVHEGRDGLELRTATGRRLRYADLEVRDAQGERIEGRIEIAAPERLRLVVADAEAVYPLAIDPLLSAVSDTRLESNQANASFGFSVAGAGDVNGDGFADVIVGARDYDAGELHEGAAFIFLGGPSGIADGSPTTAATQLESDSSSSEFGAAVAGAGDVNGDGFADVIVGAPVYSAGEFAEGAAFVFLGGPSGIADGNPTTAAAQLESNQALARFGAAVSGAGDANGDGYADVIVGAPLYDNGEPDEGGAFVFLGGPSGVADGNPATAAEHLEPDQADARFGTAVAYAGSVLGDTRGDLIIGAPGYDYDFGLVHLVDAGAAFLVRGVEVGSPGGAFLRQLIPPGGRGARISASRSPAPETSTATASPMSSSARPVS